ncbi:hypothetical protein ATER59S_05514 [Aquamicrobium terrae]
MADQVHDAGLDDRLREDGTDGLGEALQPVDDGDQDVADTAVLQLVHDAQPEFGALRLLDPDAEYLLRAVGQNAERDVDGLVAHEAFVPDLDPNGVEEDQRETGVERPILPFGHLFQHRVGDGRDQVRRDVDTVEFLQVAADLAHAHAARIHGDDLVVELGEAALIFGDRLRIERAGPVPWDRKLHLRRACQHRLLRMPVAPVARPVGLALIVEMLVKLGVQNALR